MSVRRTTAPAAGPASAGFAPAGRDLLTRNRRSIALDLKQPEALETILRLAERADAAGLPILAGLVRYDEVAAGSVNHALRFTVQRTQRGYILPATHAASSSHTFVPVVAWPVSIVSLNRRRSDLICWSGASPNRSCTILRTR